MPYLLKENRRNQKVVKLTIQSMFLNNVKPYLFYKFYSYFFYVLFKICSTQNT